MEPCPRYLQHGPGGHRIDVGPLVGGAGCRAKVSQSLCQPAGRLSGSCHAGWRPAIVLGLMLAHWWARVSGYRALGVPWLVPAMGCVWPSPQPSGGHGLVPGWLWASGILRQPVCWCPCPASCLVRGISVLAPIGCKWDQVRVLIS